MTSRVGEHVRRAVQAVAGGTVVTAGCALYETALARASAGGAPAFGACFAITLGLVAPIGLAVSCGVALTFALLSPESPASVRLWFGKLRSFGAGRQADLAAFVPLVVLAAFVWMTASAHIARALLALPIGAGLAGIGATGGALGAGLCLAIAALAAVPILRKALAKLAATRPSSVDPVVTGALATVVVIGLFAVGVVTGTVSGEGNVLGIYGIFRRPELDLRAPAELLAIALGATVAPSFARPPRTPSRSMLLLVAVVSAAPLALLVRAATAMNRDVAVTQAVERGAPLSRLVIGPARKLTDRDHDGVSGLFGGGDCNDHDRAINPQAEEILDDGIDQDCSGADLTQKNIEELAPVAPPPKVDTKVVPPGLNVVLITVDTLRADLGYAGYSRPITPHLDALAARSTVFERAYSLASYTGKSVGPLLIGKYSSETDRNWGHFNKFGARDTFVAERLHQNAFRTMSVQGHRYFEGSGFERGFDVMDLDAAPPKDAKWDVASTTTSPILTDSALALLANQENTKGRFFLWVHYLDPHADYLRHEGFEFGSDSRALYDGEVAFTDEHVGRLIDAISKAPFGERTAIIVTSDHGETFGEHGMYNHGFEVWEPLVRVPLLVFVPGAKPHRIHERRSAIDIVPTILDLAGVARPETPEKPSSDATPDDYLSGVTLLADVFPREGDTPAVRDILVDMTAGPHNDSRRAYIHGDLKMIVSNEVRFDLYDLDADPAEGIDLADRDRVKFKDMKDRYAALKARLHENKVGPPK